MKHSIDSVIKLVVPEFAEERVINSGWSPSEDNLKNNEYVLFCGYKDADTELTDYYGNHYVVISTGYLPINLIECVLYNSADNIYYVGKADDGDSVSWIQTIKNGGKEEMICPKCGGNLIIRTAKRGVNAGSQFYGCSNYPNCKFTRDI